MMVLDGHTFVRMLQAGAQRLASEEARVNALNVFPVPDGDTGTNMMLTMQAAVEKAKHVKNNHVGEAAQAAARGALLGARGNSGVILSQFFAGLAEGLAGHETADGTIVAQALESATQAAYKAVLDPVEGTMLSVGRAGAEAARVAVQEGSTLQQVLQSALLGARTMLANTPSLLETLKEAGVVDAGGEGIVVAADGAFKAMLNGAASFENDNNVQSATSETSNEPVRGIAQADITYTYCTEFLIHGTELCQSKIQDQFATLPGDSLLVVGDTEVIKVHIHTNEPWEAFRLGAQFGQLAEVHATNMVLQNEEAARHVGNTVEHQANTAIEHEHNGGATGSESEDNYGIAPVVAVIQGDGFQTLLEELGVRKFVSGGQSMNPSTEELLEAVEAIPSHDVIILPNNSNVMLSAEQVVQLSSKRVFVVPTKSTPEAISAMFAYNDHDDMENVYAAMCDELQHVRVGEITRAVRDARMNNHTIRTGQFMGLFAGEIVTVGDKIADVMEALIAELYNDESEIITLYYGCDVTEEDASKAQQFVQQRYAADVDVQLYAGGQPLYDFIITVE